MPDEILKKMKDNELSGETVMLENKSERILGFNGSNPVCYVELIPGVTPVPVEYYDSIRKRKNSYWDAHKEKGNVAKVKEAKAAKKKSKKKDSN